MSKDASTKIVKIEEAQKSGVLVLGSYALFLQKFSSLLPDIK